MITFNSVDLTSVAPVKIEDIIVSPIQLQPVARQRAVAFGSDFVRMGGGARTITIRFALLTQENREPLLQAIRDWARTDAEYSLTLPGVTDRHLVCVCTRHPDVSLRKWWDLLQIEFTCFSNPFWTSDTIKEASCGDVSFQVNGSAPPIMVIERTLEEPATAQEYQSGDHIMSFSSIPAGNLTINLTRQTADVDGVSIMQNYDPTSEWIEPRYNGEFQTIGGIGQIKICERWI